MSDSNAKRLAKAAKDTILTDLCNSIDIKKRENNLSRDDRIPRGFVAGLVAGVKPVCPWISRDAINNEYRRRRKNGIFYIEAGASLTTTGAVDIARNTVSDITLERKKGGRPVGASNKNKNNLKLAVIASKNEIATLYKAERDQAGKKRLKRGRLDDIIKEVKERNSLPDDIVIDKPLIRQRMKQNIFVSVGHAGLSSPLTKIEPEIVETLIQLSKMRQSLTPSQSVKLINSMITGTDIQQKLISFKQKYSHGGDGTVGVGYWNGFKKRNADKIVSKRGQKYELDRDNWTTYSNFLQMYDQIYEEMEEAGVARKLLILEW